MRNQKLSILNGGNRVWRVMSVLLARNLHLSKRLSIIPFDDKTLTPEVVVIIRWHMVQANEFDILRNRTDKRTYFTPEMGNQHLFGKSGNLLNVKEFNEDTIVVGKRDWNVAHECRRKIIHEFIAICISVQRVHSIWLSRSGAGHVFNGSQGFFYITKNVNNQNNLIKHQHNVKCKLVLFIPSNKRVI